MCGRYTLATPVGRLAEEFGFDTSSKDFRTSYNVAPKQQVPAVLAEGGTRRLEMLRWGLVPSWADDPGVWARMITARSETAPEKPSFRSAFRRRRCLIPADGFYEWKRLNGSKQPYYFRIDGGRPFAFAGPWETWNKDGEKRHAPPPPPRRRGPPLRLRRPLGELEQGRRDPLLRHPHDHRQRPRRRGTRADAGHTAPRPLRRLAGPRGRGGRARRPAGPPPRAGPGGAPGPARCARR